MTESEGLAEGALLGHYRLEERLAVDIFGEVWRGVHQVSGGATRVRVLRGYEVLRSEGKRLAGLSQLAHGNLAGVIEVHVDVQSPHIVYAPMTGAPLAEFIADAPIPWPNAAEIIRQLCAGLQHLHAHGIAHGRIGPDAVLLTEDEGVVLQDIGVQAALDPNFLSGVLAGDPYAMPGADSSPATDLWSIGALLWSTIAGRAPEPELPSVQDIAPDAPPALDEIIARCRQPAQESDPYTAAQVAADLLDIMMRELTEQPAGDQPEQEAEAPATAAEDIPDTVAPELAPPDIDALDTPAERETAPAPVATQPPDDRTTTGAQGLEDELIRLQRERRREGPSPQLDARITSLAQSIGRAQLYPLVNVKGIAAVRKPGVGSVLGLVVYALLSLAGFGGVWLIVRLHMQQAPIAPLIGQALTGVALVAYICLALWLAVCLGVTSANVRCLVEIREDEIECWNEKNSDLVARVRAEEIREVRVRRPSADAVIPDRVRIRTRAGATYAIDFDARPHPAR